MIFIDYNLVPLVPLFSVCQQKESCQWQVDRENLTGAEGEDCSRHNEFPRVVNLVGRINVSQSSCIPVVIFHCLSG